MLSAQALASYAVLKYLLESALAIPATQTALTPFRNDSGFHTLASQTAIITRIETPQEGEAWIARIKALPAYLEQNQYWMTQAIAKGMTQPRSILEGIADQMAEQLSVGQQNALFLPMAELPETIEPKTQAWLQKQAIEAINTKALPALNKLFEFFTQVYMPASRDQLALRSVPGGEAMYRSLVIQHTTLNVTPEDIHERGWKAVARI